MITLLLITIYVACIGLCYFYIKADAGKATSITITDKDGNKTTFESDTHTIKSIKL